MPTVSKKQEKFMQAVANNPKFAKKVGVNQSIGREFTKEKSMKTKKMMGGGMTDRMGRAMASGRLAGRPGMMADARGRAMMKKGGKVKKDDDKPLEMIKPGATRFFDSDEVRAAKRKADQKNKKRMDKKAGTKVKKMKRGGNTSRMNELEELGRVDAEKGYTAKGKRNLRDEKKRVVREIENKKAGGKVKGYKAGGMTDKEGRALAKNKRGMSAAKMADARGRAMKSGGATMKAKGKGTQGYNARLDESLGMRKGKASTKSQSYKSRRDESKGMKKAAGKKAYSGNRSSAQGSASKRADGIAQRGRTKGRMR